MKITKQTKTRHELQILNTLNQEGQMKLVSRSIYLDQHNATMHMQCEKKDHNGFSRVSLRGWTMPSSDGANARHGKEQKRKTKRSGIFSGPSLAYAER